MSDIGVLEQFRRLFRGREDAHGEYTPLPDGDKRVKTLKSPASPELWENHLAGIGPFLGQVPVRKDGMCYFGAIDVDNHGDDEDIDIVAMEGKVRKLRLPLMCCRSKSGGVHLYLFCKEPIPATLIIKTMKSWLVQLGLPKKTEIFPKQTKAEVGNWINLPYYDAANTNRYAVIDGEQADLGRFLAEAALTLVTAAKLEGIEDEGDDHPFRYGPPCLIQLHRQGLPEGGRNRAIYNVAIYFKIAGEQDWKEQVKAYNQDQCDPPLDAYEISTLLRSVEEHDEYKYGCTEEPICSVCNKTLCLKKRLGIGFWRQGDITAAMPKISGMVELKTDPPRYFVKIDDVTVEMDPQDFMTYTRFKLHVMIAVGRIPPAMRQYEWEERANVILAQKQVIEAPPDAGVFGQFKYLLNEFLGRYRQGEENPEELLRGHPFSKNGRIYFRSHDLFQFLDTHRFRAYTEAETYSALHKMDAGNKQFRVGDTMVRAWFVPVPEEDFQTEVGEIPRNIEDPNKAF